MQKILATSFCALFTIHLLSSQTINTKNELQIVLKGIEKAMLANDKLYYKAEMLFKGFAQDTYEVRNFIVAYKVNQNNTLYGYDMEISEFKSDQLFTLFTLDSLFYVIPEGSMQVSILELPTQVERGSYLETLRQYFIFSEYLYPFLNGSSDEITFLDSADVYILIRNTSEISTRKVYISKNTFLPQMYTSTIYNYELGLTQTQHVNFSFDSNCNEIPLNVFSPKHYLTSGYQLVEVERQAQIDVEKERTISNENLSLLLNYPFIHSKGDTIILNDFQEKYFLLDFWFASCLPCLKALPELNEISEKYAKTDLKVIGINCFDLDNIISLTTKLNSKNITIPMLYGKQDILTALELKSFPSYYLLSKDGSVQYLLNDIESVKEIISEFMSNK